MLLNSSYSVIGGMKTRQVAEAIVDHGDTPLITSHFAELTLVPGTLTDEEAMLVLDNDLRPLGTD